MNDLHNNEVRSGAAWAEFWGGSHSIYVNARHAAVHYARIADDLAGLLESRQRPRVLDWGCGDAFGAPALAGRCRELLLYDGVGAVRARIASRFASTPAIRVLDEGQWQSLERGSVDVIILNSVAQYMAPHELEVLLDEFRERVAPTGDVILADIIPPDTGMVPDVLSLLAVAARNGFLPAAVTGLARTYFSPYRALRKQAGFSTYTEAAIRAMLERHGFAVQRLPANVGFNQQRMTFRAKLA